MKKVVTLTAMLFAITVVFAQTENIDKLMQKYKGQEGVTLVNISPSLFQLFSDKNNSEVTGEFPLDKLDAVKVLSVENEAILKGSNFLDDVTSGLNLDKYEEVISVNDGADDVRMWLNNEGKQIREFFLVVSSNDEGVVVYISGDFNMSDIEGIAESIGGIEELEALEALEIN